MQKDTPRVQGLIEAYLEAMKDVPVENLIFLDETGSNLEMTRTMARAPQGQRAVCVEPKQHSKNMTILGAINWEQTLVMTNLLGGVNKGTFLTFLDELIKKLTKKDVVILDNTRIHKNPEVRRRIEAVGARVL